MKLLRIVGYIVVVVMILGVVVSSRPIITPSVRLDDHSEKGSLHKKNIFKELAQKPAQGESIPVPEWVKEEAMRQVKGTSYISSLKAYSAWKSKNTWNPNYGTYAGSRRPGPSAPSDSGDILIDNNWNNDGRVNNDATYQQFHPASCVGTDGTIYVAWAQEINTSNY
ncbi:MAG: hypothetical protein ACP5G4_09295, partial [bacterium]